MGAWCHFLAHHWLWTLLILVSNPTSIINGQVALKTLPLTADNSSYGHFRKWPGVRRPSLQTLRNPENIENKLADIFRGVAYGVTTEPPTTTTTTSTTTTTTTTTTPVTKVQSRLPSTLGKERNVLERTWQKESDAKPVVKSPITGEENSEASFELVTENSTPKIVTVESEISDIAWVAAIGVPWQIHVYVIAGLFSLLALLSLFCLARVHLAPKLLPKGYYITVHLLVFLAAFFRSVFFFHDPYAVSHRLPSGLASMLFNTGMPCIITALAVLSLALLRAARLKLLPLKLQSPIAVAIISSVLIVGSVIVDILEGVISEKELTSGLRAGIQALSAGWSSALCIGYIVIFNQINRSANRQQIEMLRLSLTRIHVDGSPSKHMPLSSLSHGARATLIACISGLLLAILQVYGLMNSNGIAGIPPQFPWIWFAYQSSCRFLEFIMWTCICIAAALPSNYAKSQRNHITADDNYLLSMFACNRCCASCCSMTKCCYSDQKLSDDVYSTICQTNHVARNFGQDEKLIFPQDTITTTRKNARNVSTTLLPPISKKSERNVATLHSGYSDVHLLWNNSKGSSNSPNCSSRPSSLVLTEGGVIKFRTHDPKSNNMQVLNFSKPFDSSNMNQDVHKKILQSCNGPSEDNYINSGALTPEEKRVLEYSLRLGNIPTNLENKLNNFNSQAHFLKKDSFKSEGDIQGKYYEFDHNNHDLHVYEDGDQVCYQSPSLDSSVDSNGHLYASVVHSPFQNRAHIQTTKKNKKDKILNNDVCQSKSGLPRRSNTTSPIQDVSHVDYLTDASQEYISPQKDNPTGSSHFEESSSLSSHVYKCYNSKGENNITDIMISNYSMPIGSTDEDKSENNEGFQQLPEGSIFSKIIPSSKVYSPLRTDDISFTAFEGHKSFYRPTHPPLSPVHGQNVIFTSPPNSPRRLNNINHNKSECVSQSRQNQLSPFKNKLKKRQEKIVKDENGHSSFSSPESHSFLSERNNSICNEDFSLNPFEVSVTDSMEDLTNSSVKHDDFNKCIAARR